MDLDPYALRIFCQVMSDKTFSAAARSLDITQPTVSQQIAKLEARLGGKLFERVRHDVTPTALANELLGLATGLIEQMDRFGDRIQNQRSLPTGLVRYAMPESCQWTPHFRRIMSQIRDVPGIRFEIDILPSEPIVEGLLSGHYDFGFVVGERISPELRFEKFGDEHYSAVGADKKLFDSLSSKAFEEVRIISYPGWESFFTAWSKAHGLYQVFRRRVPQPSVRIGTLAGAIHAAQEGGGVAVIPTHCVLSELETRRLHAYQPAKGAGATQAIHVARKLGRELPHRARVVLDLLKKAKEEIG